MSIKNRGTACSLLYVVRYYETEPGRAAAAPAMHNCMMKMQKRSLSLSGRGLRLIFEMLHSN